MKLTKDEIEFLVYMIEEHVIYNHVRQSIPRIIMAKNIASKLSGKNYEPDHSQAENIINEKIKNGTLKMPKRS